MYFHCCVREVFNVPFSLKNLKITQFLKYFFLQSVDNKSSCIAIASYLWNQFHVFVTNLALHMRCYELVCFEKRNWKKCLFLLMSSKIFQFLFYICASCYDFRLLPFHFMKGKNATQLCSLWSRYCELSNVSKVVYEVSCKRLLIATKILFEYNQ